MEAIKQDGGTVTFITDQRSQLADESIKYAIKTYGRVDVLLISGVASRGGAVPNAGGYPWIDSWDASIRGHVEFAFRSVRAAWPYFRKQKFGRIVIMGEVYDGVNDILCTAARFALTGLTKTTSLEGFKYNILCNLVTPSGSELVPAINMDLFISHVAVLAHSSNSKETGSVFMLDGSQSAKLIWQRSAGVALKPNETLTPGAVIAKWPQYFDFSQATYPSTGIDFNPLLEMAIKLTDNELAHQPNFAGKVVLVTGAGAG